MRASRRGLIFAIVFMSSLYLPQVATAQSDQAVVERILGPRWKQVSRRAGMIFAGTVLSGSAPRAMTKAGANQRVSAATSTLELNFRVDDAIAGVKTGQVITIHEWVGAWSMHRPMRSGEHILIFLYPLSRLGLTSPVGGSLGQIVLDESGKNVSEHELRARAAIIRIEPASRTESAPVRNFFSTSFGTVSVMQLKRAIRSAREE